MTLTKVHDRMTISSVAHVESYGAAGDGVTDDSDAILSAIAARSAIEFGNKTYYCAEDITISKDITVIGNGATIVFAPGKRLAFVGQENAGESLTSSVLSGVRTIPVTETCAPDDIIWMQGDDSTTPAANITLSSNTLSDPCTVAASSSVFTSGDVGKNIILGSGTVYIYAYTSGTQVECYVSNNNAPATTSYTSGNWSLKTLFAQSRPYYERGELLKVESYASGTATTVTATELNYTSGEANVYRIQPISVYVENLNVEASRAGGGILVYYNSSSEFYRVNVNNPASSSNGIELLKCYDVNILTCSCNVKTYGVVFNGCQECTVNGGSYIADSHAVEFSSSNNTPPSTRILCTNVSAHCPDDVYAINCHAGSAKISVTNNQVTGGISVNGMDSFISNNAVTYSGSNEAIRLRPEAFGQYLKCTSNTVYSSGTGIDYRENFADAGSLSVEVANNSVLADIPFQYIRSFILANMRCKEMTVSNNMFRSLADEAVNISLSNKPFANKGVSFNFDGNTIKGNAGGSAVSITGSTSYNIENISITNNSIVASENKQGIDIQNVKGCLINSNELIGEGSGGTRNEVNTVLQTLLISDNMISNFTQYNGLYFTTSNDIKDILVYNNVYDSASETGGTTADTTAPFMHLRAGKTRWLYDSAAPTSNTWAKGDIVFNDNPSAGGTLGWVCTAGGTPGTWKTFGAISA